MLNLMRDRYTAVWGALVAASLVSWYFGTDHNVSSLASSTLIVVVALAKVWLIGRYFMDLRAAPAALRRGFDFYCVALCGALLGIYHFA